ncbi:MAG: thiamine biosynthesis protein ThiF [Jatrophihabitantaceae bacterium]
MTAQPPQPGAGPTSGDSSSSPPATWPASRRLNRATVVLWRSRRVMQLELGARRIVVEGVEPEQLSALLWRPAGGLPAAPPRSAVDGVAELTAVLDKAGFLVGAGCEPFGQPATPARLTADLGALTAQFGDRAVSVLQARRGATVAVHGTSRLATSVAATFAAAGVGWIQLVHGGEVSASDACPGGVTPADEGRRFTVAADEAVRRCGPDVVTSPIPPDRRTDLVVLTDPAPVDSSLRSALHQDQVPHLPASVDGQRAVVGPLVLPGRTGCLRCADLHRTDRDPAWPALAVQLSARPRRRITSDVALCVATVGVAVGQALAYLDRQHPATIEASLEWQLPDWRLRRRSWPVHHACDCGAATAKPPGPPDTAE